MLRTISVLAFSLLCGVQILQSQTPVPKDVGIPAPDGVKLRATYFAAAKPGPGVLLLHMCNTTRKSWEPVAKELSERGIHALTIDNRGFGESGGPRFEGASPEIMKQLNEKWPDDFDAAYQFLISQPGVDKTRIAAGGGSCGVGNAVQLAERHQDLKALVLLAGTTNLDGISFLIHHPEIPIFTAGAADDQYSPVTLQVMKWYSEVSGNPRNKFAGFPNGRHGTEIFGPHPELVHQIADFLSDALKSSPTGPATPRKTPASDFWALATQPGGGARVAQLFHDARKRDPGAMVFPEFAVNFLGYERLQDHENDEAIQLFLLNTEAYPSSANTQDSLSDGYLAAGKNDLALKAEERCLELLPADNTMNADLKAALEKFGKEKIAKLKGEGK
jgi:dienelactone hydrolase